MGREEESEEEWDSEELEGWDPDDEEIGDGEEARRDGRVNSVVMHAY